MKIYTRKGDEGMTSLATGEKVTKHDERVDLYGTVDELNSYLGVATSSISSTDGPDHLRLTEEIRAQQCLLFELGAELAGYFRLHGISVVRDEDVSALEQSIDRMSADLPPMKSFILPGGTVVSAHLHVARTVCRRLERQMSLMQSRHPGILQPQALRYINRLSDYLFTAARYANHLAGTGDIPWHSRSKDEAR